MEFIFIIRFYKYSFLLYINGHYNNKKTRFQTILSTFKVVVSTKGTYTSYALAVITMNIHAIYAL